jgi:formylglycine-generating enzyme required for sulfatase activity
MKRLLHHPLRWTFLFLPAVAVGLIEPATPAPAAPADDLPRVEKANHKGYAETLPGSTVAIDMVPIPGGVFVMGSPPGEAGRGADEGPQHPVRIAPFWMAKTEMTWEQFEPFWKGNVGNKDEQIKAEKNPEKYKDLDAISRPTSPYGDYTFGFGHHGFPAISMAHHNAMDFCRWLSQKTGKAYRLPTEAEWEWAARAGSKTAYFFGDDPKQLGEYAWFAGNSEEVTHKVGTRKPNPWGLHDVYGNVAEWCLDRYTKDAYSKFPLDKPLLEPVVLPTADRFPDVVRGGSWADPAVACRSATRRGSEPGWIKQDPQRPRSIWWLTDGDMVGFRIVRAVEEQPNLKGIRSKVRWSSPDPSAIRSPRKK